MKLHLITFELVLENNSLEIYDLDLFRLILTRLTY